MEYYIPKLRRISDVIATMHEEDPFCALYKPFIISLIRNKKITAMKYGDAWLINLDELYAYLQYKQSKKKKIDLPLKKNMMTSGQIYRLFRDYDNGTILRKPNMRRFCKENSIHSIIDDEVHKPLYDFNELLMKINPNGICKTAPMPIIRRFETAVNDLRVEHNGISNMITWKLAFQIRDKGNFYRERYGGGWILNYKEFEEQIMKALDE